MGEILIFGIQEAARLACAYLREDTGHRPVAYTVTSDFMPTERVIDGLPVVAFETVSDKYPASMCNFLVAMSYRDRNRHRARIFETVKSLGYGMISYISPRAVVFPRLSIGENTMILEGCVVSPGCKIGSDVMIQAGCVIAHDARIGDHAFLGPGAVLSGSVELGPYAFVGSGTVVRDRVQLGEGSFIAMGSVVRDNAMPWTNYDGVPAKPWHREEKDPDDSQPKI